MTKFEEELIKTISGWVSNPNIDIGHKGDQGILAQEIIALIKKEIEDKLLIKCECENGDCPNCQRLCELIDKL